MPRSQNWRMTLKELLRGEPGALSGANSKLGQRAYGASPRIAGLCVILWPTLSLGFRSLLEARPSVKRLVDTEFSASRQRDLGESAPGLFMNLAAGNVLRRHLRDKALDFIAHQIKLMTIISFRGVKGDF